MNGGETNKTLGKKYSTCGKKIDCKRIYLFLGDMK